MNAIETWLVNLTGDTYLWVAELFLIVVAVLFAGFLLNKSLIAFSCVPLSRSQSGTMLFSKPVAHQQSG